MENTHYKAKKSLGQNFLKSVPALNMMTEAGDVESNDIILEVGPGKGALTSKLLEKAKFVFAIEKDRDLVELLKDKFQFEIKNGKLILVEGDVLDFNPSDYNLKEHGYKIIANIPYNITGAIIKKFLSETLQPERMVLLVQKEVAERIVARDGKESILSLSIKAYGSPAYMMKVGKRFFSPSPKVDSAIIAINKISKNNFITQSNTEVKINLEENFFKVVKAGFAHKRKVLRKNLEDLGIKQDKIDEVFKKLHLDSKTRAEDVPFPTWLDISLHLQ